jgi:coenzyme F420-reducing hydrogenase gamma subunit
MKPKVAFFDFTGCEGCQFEFLNLEPQDLLDILGAVEVVNFREAISERSDDYDIAIIDGGISTAKDVERIMKIRGQAKILVATGACATIGGMNCMKNFYSMDEVKHIVYGDCADYYQTIPAKPISAVVPVDYCVYACPPTKSEYAKVLKALLQGKKPEIPNYPVCSDCKMAGNECVFFKGMTCMGPVTRAGCGAICVTHGQICWGCRGLVPEPNTNSEKEVLAKYGLTTQEVVNKFRLFVGLSEVAK